MAERVRARRPLTELAEYAQFNEVLEVLLISRSTVVTRLDLGCPKRLSDSV
ncbi:MAG: hypothetical protein JRM80_01725 [Nitrososphaerota archaeon]|nr:hypothetical protein [Nitrososphaerota archaeon]